MTLRLYPEGKRSRQRRLHLIVAKTLSSDGINELFGYADTALYRAKANCSAHLGDAGS